MNAQDLQTLLLQRVAKFVAMDVPMHQIAHAVNLPAEKLEQLTQLPAFKAVLEAHVTEQLEAHETLNRGWDTVEDLAVSHILEHLQATPDPDFALRVAAVANKAVRRGAAGNRPLEAQTQSVVINLSTHFVQKLQQLNVNHTPAGIVGGIAMAKRIDTMSVSDAEKILIAENTQLAREFAESVERDVLNATAAA